MCLATLLDPRFKDKFFSGNIIRATVREMLVDEMTQLSISPVTARESAAAEPIPSHPKRTCPLESTVLLDVISEIITDSNGDTSSTSTELENFQVIHCWITRVVTLIHGGVRIRKGFLFYRC